MRNGQSLFNQKAAVLTIPLVAYFFASLFQSHFLGNILSPVNALAASGVLFYSFLRLRDHKLARISTLLNAVACLAWGIADIFWAVQAFGGADPAGNQVIWVLYSLTNLFLVFSFLVFAAVQFSKWNTVQMAADVLATTVASGVFLWIVFCNKDWSLFDQLLRMDYTSLFSIIMDVFLAVGVFIWFFAVRTGNVPRYLLLIAAGVSLFALTDLLYYYLDLKDLYLPNTLLDFLYIFALYCTAMGGLRKTCLYKSGKI